MSLNNSASTVLNYYVDPGKDGDHSFFDGTIIESRREYAEVPVQVMDLRRQEQRFSLDRQGFQLLMHPSIEKDFDDTARIKDVYYRECAEVLQNITGATRVHIMSHIVRRQSWEKAIEDEKHLPDMEPVKQPSTARFVHVDQSYTGARALLDLYLPEESEKLTKTRWAIVNFWRPIQTINREALCVCDAQSVSDQELRERPLKMAPQKCDAPAMADVYRMDNSMWSVVPPKCPEQHRWYYASHMVPDEALCLKIFDSKLDGTARRTPHTAFTTKGDFGPPRNSLETRCFVFWEDQSCE
ncbi:hypothetical protein N7509_000929 [Penicillium cosmopolitanum]|uniref:GA4 desaturase family protein n=1 Tax=Penicillium cosmopolitanum TaxID=1131564 RepID=A0A9X0BEJ5_9EURO|nr:uncharacterized protein N7509_000929 [Penicillium cosmopolitanum]KAJ5414302.1 hypothetical protein N7509_000929 [Penicillium cosmopolitanum]